MWAAVPRAVEYGTMTIAVATSCSNTAIPYPLKKASKPSQICFFLIKLFCFEVKLGLLATTAHDEEEDSEDYSPCWDAENRHHIATAFSP
jgi:hypothetical protein